MFVHANHPDVTKYVAAIRSSALTLVNASEDFFAMEFLMKPMYERPYGLLVQLMATPQATRECYHVLYNLPQLRRGTRMLVVVEVTAADGVAGLRPLFQMGNRASTQNMAVLPVRTATHDTHVYVHYPFGGGGGVCGWRLMPTVLDRCLRLPHLDHLYPAKEPRQFNGCRVGVQTDAPPPAVIDAASRSERPLVAGFELALTTLIAGRLNLTTFKFFGSRRCASAYSYYTDPVRWYEPVAGPRSQWRAVMGLFQAPLWLANLVDLLVNASVWRAADVGGSYAQCLFGSLLTLLIGAVPLPRRTHRRLLVTAWTLCSLVLIAAYQSQLLSTLLTPVPGPQHITTQRELMLASVLPLDYDSRLLPLARQPDWPIRVMHARKFRVAGAPHRLRAVLQTELTARFRARTQADSLVALAEVAAYRPLCVQFEQPIASQPAVDRLLARLAAAGIVAKFLRVVEFSRWTPDEREYEPLSLGHLGFAFVTLLMGCALALVVFVDQVVRWRVLCTRVRSCWRTGATPVLRLLRRGHRNHQQQLNHQ